MSTAEHSVSSAVRMAAVQLDARVGQIARALSQVPERQSGDACSLASRRFWSSFFPEECCCGTSTIVVMEKMQPCAVPSHTKCLALCN